VVHLSNLGLEAKQGSAHLAKLHVCQGLSGLRMTHCISICAIIVKLVVIVG
jgi:hypothetical protein